MPAARGGRRIAWALGLPVAAAALVAGVVAAHVSGAVPFDSDEANHANLALRQFQDLRDGRFLDFLRHSYRTGQFPFFHGWTVVPWFALLGPTLAAARVAQCAHFVVGAAATAWAAYRASGDDRRAGAVAGWLFALSPLLAAFSGLCMLETPGAAATALSLAVFAEACRAQGRRAAWLHAATAAAVLLTYFTKLNYGIWIAPAVAAGHAVRWLRARDRRAAARDAAIYLGVLVAVAAVWYSTQAQRDAFRGFLHNPAQAVSVERDAPEFRVPGFAPGNFAAYFPLVASQYHASALVGAAALLAFAWGARRALRDAPVAAAAACLAWTWLVLSMGFREYPTARFIASALPALWIVAACGAADLLRRLPASPLPVALGALVAGAGLGAQFASTPSLQRSEYEVGTEFEPVFEFVERSVPPPASVLVVGYTDHTSARTISWRLATRPGAAWRDFDVVGLNSERIFESDRRLREWMSRPRPWGDARWASYVVEFAPGPRYPDAALLVPATVRLWSDALRSYGPRLARAAERRFDDLDVTVTVWRDVSPPAHEGLRAGR